ncbi:MAG: LamG-like jellyroll fold domain-containing protein [Patescibacteria group bacterium]|nr:prepilin-type N-terminal cleavage/methylation domain-containing protein [Patescibacteria group bacterium]MBU1877124.1 prepilin-type N-terminal cleavage/methylation domain-containing protein [Patescibacteria group bacterium]
MKKAFTLIELLVVISIIGLLSSIVLVNTRGSREKARIAKALEFSQTIHNSLGSEAVGIWDFDSCNTQDSSGYGNNGTINGAVCSSDTPYLVLGQGNGKHSLSFDGVDDYVRVPSSSSLNFGGSEITMEVWIYPHNPTAGYTMFIRKQTPGYGLWILINGKLYAEIYHPNWNTGEGYTSVNSSTVLQPNRWYHIVATYKQNQYFKIYLDGKEDGSVVAFDKSIGTSSSDFLIGYLGWMGSGNVFFDGIIDGVHIYSQSLSQSQIQQYYAEGLEMHKNLTIK